MANSIYEAVKILLNSSIKTADWYKENRPEDLKLIQDKEENVLRAFQALEFIEQVGDIPINQELICIPKQYANLLPDNIKIHPIHISGELKNNHNLKNERKRRNNRQRADFSYGSSYYEGCDQYNAEWLGEEAREYS